jgi:hypothetical protein
LDQGHDRQRHVHLATPEGENCGEETGEAKDVKVSGLTVAIDWMSKGLTLLVLLLAVLVAAWQCFEGLAKLTTIGAEFRHFIVNRKNFDRWLFAMMLEERADEQQRANEARARAKEPPCEHRPVTTSAGPFCEKCGEEL